MRIDKRDGAKAVQASPAAGASGGPAARARKGRGAVSNRDGRFERLTRWAVDDGWPGPPLSVCPDTADGPSMAEQPDVAPSRTEIFDDRSRSVIARNRSPDIPFDRSINPYRGCEHGCAYCFARPTHAYLGLSPGLDFETKLFVKRSAPELLRAELARPGYRCRAIQLGANTDPYQPVERRLRITRGVLTVLADCRHPVSITTKSNLVLRDLDILAPMAAAGLAAVALSITTLDPDLARRLEPRAPTPAKRLAAVRRMADAGVPVSVMVAPVVPALTDHEPETIIRAAADAGADTAGYILLRLPGELADLFTEWLQAHVPGRARRVLNRLKDSRAGALYRADWGQRQTGTGVEAELLSRRFDAACRRAGIGQARSGSRPLRTDLFRPPSLDGQLSLF